MKKYYMILIILVLSIETKAQGCLENGVTFYTQVQIDLFSVSNQSCTVIEGDVTINESTPGDITNLIGLAQLTKIDGNLRISENTTLNDLSGLNNLSEIHGNLIINDNPSLVNLNGLGGLIAMNGDITISHNEGLTSLYGFEHDLFGNDGLTVSDNPNLTNFVGWKDTGLGGKLKISNNENLQSLIGLEILTGISGTLEINNNPSLINLEALFNLKKIGGSLVVSNNDLLSSLFGLENIDHTSILGLSIHHCSGLSYCHIESICNYLSIYPSLSLPTTISDNKSGCEDIPEVEEACGIPVNTNNIEELEWNIYPNPASDYIILPHSPDRIFIINSIGEKIKDISLEGNKINISNLTSGIYFIRSRFENKWVIEKILIR